MMLANITGLEGAVNAALSCDKLAKWLALDLSMEVNGDVIGGAVRCKYTATVSSVFKIVTPNGRRTELAPESTRPTSPYRAIEWRDMGL